MVQGANLACAGMNGGYDPIFSVSIIIESVRASGVPVLNHPPASTRVLPRAYPSLGEATALSRMIRQEGEI